MRPIVADRVVWTVGRDALWIEDSGGPKEPCISRWGLDTPWEWVADCKVQAHCGELCEKG